MSTRRNDSDDVIPEFDFSGAIPNPFIGLIGPNYTIRSHGTGSNRKTYSVISSERRGQAWIEFVNLEIAPRRVARSGTEWIAREAIADFLGIDQSSFDLVIQVRGEDPGERRSGHPGL
jgi:hypothetical protein